MAKRLGAQIMGLGAFTKVVGDAGLTVAKRAPLPITTGNSYSASGALWAAHDALLRMRLLPRPKGKERVKFKAMVVGATGAIGSACARLLAGGRRGVPGLARDGQAAGAEGIHPARRRPAPSCSCRRRPTRTSPRWT
jgi:predicted amino acid dehydrogenase